MPGNRNTHARQDDILDLLFRHPEGLRRFQIEKSLAVTKSTITRDVARLLEEKRICESEGKLLTIDMENCLAKVSLSPDEMQALTLACRSLALNHRWNIPMASSALHKLASSQTKRFPILSEQIRQTAELISHESIPVNSRNWLKALNTAIERQEIVELDYYSRSQGKVLNKKLLPARIEPYAPGHSFYLLALVEGEDILRNFNLDFIRHISSIRHKPAAEQKNQLAELLAPENFEYSWGIFLGYDDPQEIVLRFSMEVAERVKRTMWHNTQEITEYVDENGTKDGSILFAVWISWVQEMIPWIRSWGKDCTLVKGDIPEL